MHWREGFRRIARATAVCYGVAALVGSAAYGLSEGYVPTKTYVVEGQGRTFEVEAYSEKQAAELVDHHVTANPALFAPVPQAWESNGSPRHVPGADQRRDWLVAATRAAVAALWWAGAYVALWGLFRGLRWIGRGFLDGRPAST
jgi:hypothetical protein